MKNTINRYVLNSDIIVKVLPTHDKVNLYKGAVLWMRKRVQGGYMLRIHMSETTHRDVIVTDFDLSNKMTLLNSHKICAEDILREFHSNVLSGSFSTK